VNRVSARRKTSTDAGNRGHISGFESVVSMLELSKIAHASGHAATQTGSWLVVSTASFDTSLPQPP
jgi:hypothetical protein